MQILSASEFYAQEAEYRRSVDPTWEDDVWHAQLVEERATFATVMGDPAGRSVLDCSCGPGGQAVVLASLGWRVTGSDVSAAYLDIARRRAEQVGVSLALVQCDMRDLPEQFGADFDWVVSCMALDNITDDDGIELAVRGMFAVLKPGGRCHIRLRDMDNLLEVRPRLEFKEERAIPMGTVIRLEDWDYERDTHAVNIAIYLREDQRKTGYAWESKVFAYRRRMLRKAELARMVQSAGFTNIQFLSQPSPWHPYSVVAC